VLYYARAIDCTMLMALGSLAAAKTTHATAQAVTQLLNFAATHPDAVLSYHASDMVLHIHSDAPHHSTSIDRNSFPPPINVNIHVPCSIMNVVVSSASEAELGALFHNGKEAAWLRTTLHDMGHPQPPTPIQTDNSCAAGIANGTAKQRLSKLINMRFYWICDRDAQGQFIIHWRRDSDNLADYFTKHHSPAQHRLMRSQYLLDLHRPVPPIRGGNVNGLSIYHCCISLCCIIRYSQQAQYVQET
jgi:hypothetical protein